MAEASDKIGILYQNLIDAGCDKEMTETCMELAREERKTELLRLLSCHKQNLLKTMHKSQKEIDCLDFLTFTLQKEANKTGGK